MRNRYHVTIIGGGFSGVALALQLLRRGDSGLHVTLVDAGAQLGRGVAYGTTVDSHVLNTRAADMSVFEDEPDGFLRWLQRVGLPADASAFVPRRFFGDYLEDTLIESVVGAADEGPTFTAHTQTRVIDVAECAIGFEVMLDDGRRIHANAVVLATGHTPPDDPLEGKLPAVSNRYVRNPWVHSAIAAAVPAENVLLLGSGLTMVDVALALEHFGYRGRMRALSRRGLVPRPHERTAATLPPVLRKRLYASLSHATIRDGGLRRAIRGIRQTIEAAALYGLPWQPVIDALRPIVPDLWAGLTLADRQRFLRWIRPFWETSRHRLAPQPAAALDALCAAGRLEIRAGRVTDAVEQGDSILVEETLRGDGRPVWRSYDWIINCTGPSFARRSSGTLEAHLMERGLLIRDSLGLGYTSAPDGAVFGANGPVGGLYLLGPACRPHWWEHTAVPELRQQAARLAVKLLEASEERTRVSLPLVGMAISGAAALNRRRVGPNSRIST